MTYPYPRRMVLIPGLFLMTLLCFGAAEVVEQQADQDPLADLKQKLILTERLQLISPEAAKFRWLSLSAGLEALDRNAEGDYLYGVVQLRLERKQAALTAFEAALAKEPNHVDAMLMRGVVLRDTLGVAAALPVFQRALALAPQCGDALYQMGLSFEILGQSARGMSYYMACLAVAPDHAGALLRVALGSSALAPSTERSVP